MNNLAFGKKLLTRFIKSGLPCLLFIVLAPNCAGPEKQVQQTTYLSQMQERSVPAPIPQYRLGFGDVIDIKFFRNVEFNETVTVRPDGRISLPRVGEIQVTGMTPLQLDSVITKTYDEFVVNPDITVIVRQFSGNQVYVLGEVRNPGGFALIKDMTVLQTVALAGGALDFAKLNSVMVLRKNEHAKLVATKIDLLSPVRISKGEKLAAENYYVQPQDIIYVPKTAIASAAEFMRMVYSGFLPPLDLYLRATLYYDRN